MSVYSLSENFISSWKQLLFYYSGTEGAIYCYIGFDTFPSPPQYCLFAIELELRYQPFLYQFIKSS